MLEWLVFQQLIKIPKEPLPAFHQGFLTDSLPNLKGRNSTPWPWIAGCFPRTLYNHTIPQRRKKCCCSLGPSESMLDWHFCCSIRTKHIFHMCLQPQATFMDTGMPPAFWTCIYSNLFSSDRTTPWPWPWPSTRTASKTSPHPNAWCFRTPARRASVTPQEEHSFIFWDVNTQIHQTKKNWKPHLTIGNQ